MDKHLIQLLKEEPKKGYRYLYTSLYRKIFAAKRYVKLDNDTKNDIFQEAMLSFVLKINDGSVKNIRNIEAWFSGACKYIFLNMMKESQHTLEIVGEVSEVDETDDYASDEMIKRVFKVMKSSLDEKCSELLTYYFMNGLDFDEIAQKMNYTKAFVSNKKSRCIKRLKALVKNNSL